MIQMHSLSLRQWKELEFILKSRFEQHINRHPNFKWKVVKDSIESNAEKKWALWEMERTGGEPDVVELKSNAESIIFVDCSIESPNGRRSLCYDREALDSRKENKPQNNALEIADSIGIEMLTELEYKEMFQYGPFDTRTSSWIKTPTEIRSLGGALFAEYRYQQIFVYHNGAQSYYAARGFRGKLKIQQT